MKKKIKIIALVACSIVVVGTGCYFGIKSKAATDYKQYTNNGHYLLNGVGNYGKGTRAYYIDSSASSYKTTINNAMDNWVYTTKRLNYTTPISFKSTTDRKSSVIDFIATTNKISDGVLAWTEFYKKGGSTANWNNENWNYCYVKIYTPNLNFSKYSSDRVSGTMAHEIGHCFGLVHRNTNVNSIMCQTGSGRAVQVPMKCDLEVINYLY